MSDPIETARAVMKEIDIGSRSKIINALADHEVAVRAAAIAETEAKYRGLVEAARRLRREGALSTSLGGDYGMIFDAEDAAVERRRRGTQMVDLDHWERFVAALRAIEVAETTSVTEVIEGDTNG